MAASSAWLKKRNRLYALTIYLSTYNILSVSKYIKVDLPNRIGDNKKIGFGEAAGILEGPTEEKRSGRWRRQRG
jgi:hypothetical protein